MLKEWNRKMCISACKEGICCLLPLPIQVSMRTSGSFRMDDGSTCTCNIYLPKTNAHL